MSKYHLMHCVPHPRLHGLVGYREVIDTIKWGLEQLGHEVSYALNRFEPSAINIIFGAHMLPPDFMERLPRNTIVYNFEQMRGLQPQEMRPEMAFLARRFRIWEYSTANMDAWKTLDAVSVHHVPVGYAPILSRIPRAVEQDIDVLIYGVPGPERMEVFHDVAMAGYTTLFVCGLYGAARDELISRAKLVLNVNLHTHAQIFEVVRVSYLFANRKAVLATMHPQTVVDEDIRTAVKFTSPENLVNDCAYLIDNVAARHALEEAGYQCITRPERDIRAILESALGAP